MSGTRTRSPPPSRTPPTIAQPRPSRLNGVRTPDIRAQFLGAGGAQGETRSAFKANSFQQGNQQQESFEYFSHRDGEEARRTVESFEEVRTTTRSLRLTLHDCDLVLRESTLIITPRSSESDIIAPTEVNLDAYVGNIEGKLVWGFSGFTETSENIRLEGTFLLASCLNLANHFVYMAGRRRFVAVNPDPDLMKASVDQMNFSVITRPDIAGFLNSPAFQNAVSGVARNALGDVMTRIREEMMSVIAVAVAKAVETAVEAAVTTVSNESEQYVESEMAALSMKATGTAAYSGLAQLTVMQARQKRAYNRFAPHIGAAPITEDAEDSDSDSG
ncbi:hypothetical protein B0H13DRAFT_2366392 [Mycena leptocephala]|nr:hypothetical protein B0H13DRAFT_2366392 [Mycena leptocephala]